MVGASPAAAVRRLRLLCLHGHGDSSDRLCSDLEETFFRSAFGVSGREDTSALDVQCKCLQAPFPEPKRPGGGRWWTYDEDGKGDRPADWAEMEVATTRIAEELYSGDEPFDGILGFSQGAEMVHTLAVLAHRGDPRIVPGSLGTAASSSAAPGTGESDTQIAPQFGSRLPRFLVSISGAVNPGHFESPGAGGPPRGCPGPCAGPYWKGLGLPCLFLGDFDDDSWYPAARFHETLGLYTDATLVKHAQRHTVPALDPESAGTVRSFFARFAADRISYARTSTTG